MKTDAYDLDLLRSIIRTLQAENRELKELLKRADIPYAAGSVFSGEPETPEEFVPDQGSLINTRYINIDLAKQFFSMFRGRDDVFAKRSRNGNYYPQCDNRWDAALCPRQRGEKQACDTCAHKRWKKLTPDILIRHLLGRSEEGTDVVGVYPLLADGTCRFLVFDFDNHEKGAEAEDFANNGANWQDEVDALRVICARNGVDALVERSRSGRGAHVWIFFCQPISAALARNFGFLLLDKGASSINLRSFRCYDRMYPSQEVSDSIGNLIALPLQGGALRYGNSAFVDENWNAYADQWEKLFQTRKLTQEDVEGDIARWSGELFTAAGQQSLYAGKAGAAAGTVRPKPWKRQNDFVADDVSGKLHIVLADGIYVDALNLKPRLQNRIRCLAAFDNPVYYKNKRLGQSNYGNPGIIYMGKDIDGYIQLPRGLEEPLVERCRKSGIRYEVEDQREKGRPIRVSFNGELRLQQELAAQQMLEYDHGILSAATAFGKTVVCSYLIAERKVNTLILLESTELVGQWEAEMNRFLNIDEEPPEYQTKTGRVKRRESVIGTLKGGRDTMTGIVDVAMVGSLYKKGAFHERLNSYGMVIMDECHHAASATAQQILKRVNAKYVYGVSATPMRSDNLEKINYMLLGPVRYRYSAAERKAEQGIDYLVVPRYTRLVDLREYRDRAEEMRAAYPLLSSDTGRNAQIMQDVRKCVKAGRVPVILTREKEQAKIIYDGLQGAAEHIFLFYGDNTEQENENVRRHLSAVPPDETMVLVATGQKIGEGFDCPRLDTLMLAAPVSYRGKLEQYVGRLSRSYEGKRQVVVYDYIDAHIRVLEDMYTKRLRTYKKLGFRVVTEENAAGSAAAAEMVWRRKEINAIFDAGNYMEVFEQDLIGAKREVVVSSPQLIRSKVERFIDLMGRQQERGVKAIVFTQCPEDSRYEDGEYLYHLVKEMQSAGIDVRLDSEIGEHFAVLDRKLVWHGGMNLLGKEDAWDNLMRVTDEKAAAELLGMCGANAPS